MCHRLAPVASHGASTLEKGLPVFRFRRRQGRGTRHIGHATALSLARCILSSGCDATEGRNEANLRAQP